MKRSFLSGFGNRLHLGSQHTAQRPVFRLPIYGLMICLTLASCSMPDGPDPGDISTPAANTPTERGEPITSEPEFTEPEFTEPEITLNGPGQLLPATAIAQMRNETIALEVAQTPQQQALGLMFRSALPDNRGMLFPLGNPRRARFWMKDVPVPLDMVFLRDSEIVFIAAEVPPCASLPCPSYGPETALVNQVIELRSGRAAEIGLQPGDTVLIEENISNTL